MKLHILSGNNFVNNRYCVLSAQGGILLLDRERLPHDTIVERDSSNGNAPPAGNTYRIFPTAAKKIVS